MTSNEQTLRKRKGLLKVTAFVLLLLNQKPFVVVCAGLRLENPSALSNFSSRGFGG